LAKRGFTKAHMYRLHLGGLSSISVHVAECRLNAGRMGPEKGNRKSPGKRRRKRLYRYTCRYLSTARCWKLITEADNENERGCFAVPRCWEASGSWSAPGNRNPGARVFRGVGSDHFWLNRGLCFRSSRGSRPRCSGYADKPGNE